MPTIDNPTLWFALAAVAGLALVLIVYLLGYFGGRGRADAQARDWIDMIDRAHFDCRHCDGTGWTPVYEERALARCPCTDAPAHDDLDVAPISGRAA